MIFLLFLVEWCYFFFIMVREIYKYYGNIEFFVFVYVIELLKNRIEKE